MIKKLSIIIHSYSSSKILECVQAALLLTKQIYIIGEEKRKNIKNQLGKLGIKIVFFPNSGIVETVREFGIKQAKTPWVFLLDADERITNELALEIKNAIKYETFSHYQIPRKEILFYKKWLKYGGWWPNYQIRLIKTVDFIHWPKQIHSTPVINGKRGTLSQPLLHYSQNDFEEIVNRTIIFEDKESQLLFEGKKSASTLTFFRKFLGELFRRLILWQGFRDGALGIIASIYQAFSKTITYLFLYEKNCRLRSLS